MPTLLRMPDEIYQHELSHICAPHGAYYMLRDALYGRPFPQPHFQSHLLEFLARNYNAPAHLMEDAFAELQQDLERGRVLIVGCNCTFTWATPEANAKTCPKVISATMPSHWPTWACITA